jgi:hypothetical protein
MGLCITRDGKGLPQGSRKLVMISRTVQLKLGLEPTSQALARLEARPWMFF